MAGTKLHEQTQYPQGLQRSGPQRSRLCQCQDAKSPPPPGDPPATAGRVPPQGRTWVWTEAHARTSPQHGDPDPGEGRTQANCGVWLTATGRGHRDTQPPTHKTRRGDTCPGPLRENSSDNAGIQRASTRTNQHRPVRINQRTTRHTSEYTGAGKRQSPAVPSLPALPPRPARRIHR